MNLTERFTQYLEHEIRASECTVAAYVGDLRQFGAWLTGVGREESPDVDFRSVTLGDIRAWIAYLGARGLSPRTLRRKVLSVRVFYRYLLREGVVRKNPAADLVLPRLSKPLPSLIKEEELEAIVNDETFQTTDWVEYRDLLTVDFLYSTGLRRSELLRLADPDLRTAEGEVKVFGKRRKERIVPLAPQLCERIKRYQSMRDSYLQEKGLAKTGHFLVSEKGRPLNNSTLSRIIKVKLASSTGRKTPHTLRHTFATALLRDGAEINSVKELLGHASLATTQIYTHLSFSELQHNYKLAHPRANKKRTDHGSKD